MIRPFLRNLVSDPEFLYKPINLIKRQLVNQIDTVLLEMVIGDFLSVLPLERGNRIQDGGRFYEAVEIELGTSGLRQRCQLWSVVAGRNGRVRIVCHFVKERG